MINTERAAATTQIFEKIATQTLTQQLKENGWQDVYTRWPFLKSDLSEILYH
jgi:hypothetical protein